MKPPPLMGLYLFHRALLRAAALLVPCSERREWLAEWRAEFWYLNGPARDATRFCFGAFYDALWMRRNTPHPTIRPVLCLRSPVQCIGVLAIVAAVSLFFAFRLPMPSPILPNLFMPILALIILPATTTLSLGEYPAMVPSSTRWAGLRRWMFLGMKFALVLPVVFCGIFDLAPVLSAKGLTPDATLVGYVLAFRWALIDQRKRCPVCLCLLTSPTRIGEPSHTFLEWYGTELICEKGHGLLHVPEIPTISFRTQRWMNLDSSWKSLFSQR